MAPSIFAEARTPCWCRHISPHIFAGQGRTKQDVRDYLFENTRRSVAELKYRGRWGIESSQFEGFGGLSQEVEPGDDERFAHVFKPHEYDEMLFDDTALRRRSDIYVVVAGCNAGPRLCFLALPVTMIPSQPACLRQAPH